MKSKKKTDNGDMMAFGIIAVAIVLIGVWYLFSQNVVAQTSPGQTNETSYLANNSDDQNGGDAQITEQTGTCKTNEVYFIYSDWCSHCQKMEPWVEQLIAEGYEFIKVNSQDSTSLNDARTCLDGVAQLQYIPEFVCMGNEQDHVGEFASIDDMRAFVLSCNAIQ